MKSVCWSLHALSSTWKESLAHMAYQKVDLCGHIKWDQLCLASAALHAWNVRCAIKAVTMLTQQHALFLYATLWCVLWTQWMDSCLDPMVTKGWLGLPLMTCRCEYSYLFCWVCCADNECSPILLQNKICHSGMMPRTFSVQRHLSGHI